MARQVLNATTPLNTGRVAINDMTQELYALQSDTINAGAVEYQTGATIEARIALADAACVSQGKSILFIPASMLPYDISLCPASAGVQRVREGGNASAWDILAYGATPNTWPTVPTADSSAAIQAAINTGHDVDFVGQFVKCNNLTQSTNNQILYSSSGTAHIAKGANGDLVTCTGNSVQMHNLEWRGDANPPTFTGHNVVATGNDFTMINCGSRWAEGRAVKATGNHVTIIGSNEIYHTADQTATGYDIEIGVSGTNTLYHELHGIYTSQHTGGVLLIDTGSHSLVGGKYGKLYIKSGTSPAGINGGKTVGGRINGDVTVELSSAVFAANQFGTGVITIAAGVTGCAFDESNTYQTGYTFVNNGGASNFIARQTGVSGTIDIKYGADSSLVVIKHAPSTGVIEFPGTIKVENNKTVTLKQASAADGALLLMDASNQLWLQNNVSNKNAVLMTTGTGGFVGLAPNNAYALQCDATTVAGNTRMLLYDVDNGTLERVSVGIADSGGVGYKLLRIPN